MKTVKVKVSFTGVLDIKGISNGDSLDINAGTSVEEFLIDIGTKPNHVKYIITTVNDVGVSKSYELKDGDHLSLFLPIGGG